MRSDEYPSQVEPDLVAVEAASAGFDRGDVPAPAPDVAVSRAGAGPTVRARQAPHDPVGVEARVRRSALDRGAPRWIAARCDELMPTFLEPVPARRYAPGRHRAIA